MFALFCINFDEIQLLLSDHFEDLRFILFILVHFLVQLANVFIFDPFSHINGHLFFIEVVVQRLYQSVYELLVLTIYLKKHLLFFLWHFVYVLFVFPIQIVVQQDQTYRPMYCLTLSEVCQNLICLLDLLLEKLFVLINHRLKGIS